MSELYRIAKPYCQLVFQVPHGASDAAWVHPGSQRPYFPDSFQSFGQPFYWRGDEGYSADWRTNFILMKLDKSRYQSVNRQARLRDIAEKRNVVREMTAVMVAMKPARPRDRHLSGDPAIELLLSDT